MPAITEDELTRAIERTLVAQGKIPPSEARTTAQVVMSYFGNEDSVLDNTLSKEDRDRFYWLEDAGLLTSEEEDATVSRGRSWRIHYWLLQKDRVHAANARDGSDGAPEESVYESVSAQSWKRSDKATDGPPPSG
ncbi:MAG: DUF6015 family protein [Thermoplasmata archaeon]|jgi:hypothetical protein